MISIRKLFENFRLPGQFPGKRKKLLPSQPTNIIGKSLNRIKKMGSKINMLKR